MEKIKLKHVLVAALGPVFVLSLGICVYQSLKRGHMDLVGIVVGIYYAIPAILFTLCHVAMVRWLIKITPVFLSLIAQLMLSVAFVFLFLTLWVIFEGGPYDYRGMNFPEYWVKEVQRYWSPLVYFAITIPFILKIATQNKK